MIWLAAAGCGEDAPPLDELPLRDALRADPAVIAAMPADARQRLAARLETVRAADDATDPVGGGDIDAAAQVVQADDARARRSGEPLIVGEILGDTPSRRARALPGAAASAGGAAPLPPLEVDASAPVMTPLESRALQGAAAGPLRALLAVSNAHHLRRVVGWPSGAVAIGDTVYVGGAWLAALAPADANVDGGASSVASPSTGAGAATGAPATPAAPTGANGVPDGGATPAFANDNAPYPAPAPADGGIVVYEPPTPTPSASSGDSCGATAGSGAACAASSDSSDDSCDSTTDDNTDDSCSNGTTTDDGTGAGDSCSNTTTDDGTDNSCNTTTDDGQDTNCQIARPGRPRGGTRHDMQASLFAPLAFLLTRRRR